MSDLPSRDDLFRRARDEALIRNAQLTRDAIERDGSDANIMMAGMAGVGDEVVGQLAVTAAGTFLDSAAASNDPGDTSLDKVVFDRYGLRRKPAAPSVGEVVLSRSDGSANPIAFPVPTGTRFSTSTGIQFAAAATITFPAGALSLTLAVASTQAGLDQQAAIGTITSILDTIAGSPSNLVVANTIATAGAADRESNDSYLARARQFFVTARRGTLGAIQAAALGVNGVLTATAIEILDPLGRPGKGVVLIVSDAFTPALANLGVIPPTYQAQSQQLAQTVFDALSDVRPAGIYVAVTVANVILQPIQLQLSFRAGFDVNVATLEARTAASNYVNSLAPGNTLVVNDPRVQSSLLAAVLQTDGIDSNGTAIISPPGNVTAQPLQVIRTPLSLVAAATPQTIQNVSPGTGLAF